MFNQPPPADQRSTSVVAPQRGSALTADFWSRWLGTPWMFQSRWPIFWPALLLIGLTFLFRATSLDLTISGWFFDNETRTWPWFYSTPCTVFYHLAIYPPLLVAAGGGLMALFGLLVDKTGSVNRAGWFLVLVIAIGPGLIVNVGFKQNWGRPRPHEVKEFGGEYAFTPVGSPGPVLKHNSSFPSGHAAIAFSMLALAFLAPPHRPRLTYGLFFAGATYGLCMSATRVVQGGHFTSDVMWAGGIVYLTGAVLARGVLRSQAVEAQTIAITSIDRQHSKAA